MSTRSLIGRLNADKTVDFVYCHWNGSPIWNGTILHVNYQNADAVDSLLALGNISVLGRQIGEEHSFDRRCSDTMYERELSAKGWTTAYIRDRGEVDDNHAITVADTDEYLQQYGRYIFGAEFLYLYDPKKPEGNRWVVFTPHEGKPKKFAPLKSAILKELRSTPLRAGILVGRPGKWHTEEDFAPADVDPVEFFVKRWYSRFGDVTVEIADNEICLTIFGCRVVYALTAKGADVIRQARLGTLPQPVIGEDGYDPQYTFYPIEDVRMVQQAEREKRARAKTEKKQRQRAPLRYRAAV